MLAPSPPLVLARGGLELEIELAPLALRVRRDGRALLGPLTLWAARGTVLDRFVQLTEGVMAHEELEPAQRVGRAAVLEREGSRVVLCAALGDTTAHVEVELCRDGRVVVRACVRPDGGFLRLGAGWGRSEGEHWVGLGARHGESFAQTGRRVDLGADRRYIGPDCPPEMLAVGGVPQGDYAPMPWALGSAGVAAWLETSGPGARFELTDPVEISARTAAGPFVLHLFTDPTPAARLRRFLRLTGLPALLPEWGYGHWKSRDVYAHQDDVEDDFLGYARHGLPLDAIVIDSPWETQYNTWAFNPHQFPDAPGLVRSMRRAGVRTVVWITGWTNLESSSGQMPPGEETERMHREPAPNYAPAAAAGHFVTRGGEPFVARWWMGTGSPVDFTSARADRWWREQARPVLELGVEGIKADDGEGFYLPDDVAFADGRSGAQAAWAHGLGYRRSMQGVLDEVHPGRGVLFGRSGWTGEQALGLLWGGDQVSDFWSLRVLVAAGLNAAVSGFSNWSHDVGGYLGEKLVARCPKELLLRWLQVGCFTPLLHAHGRFEQEAWTYDEETLRIYRDYLVLHERLVPYIRAAAATAARCGLPIIRPLCLLDPEDPRGWEVADAYGFGPALWVAPVLEAGAHEREVPLPRGEWIDFWTGECVTGGGTVTAAAPLHRVPLWVRAGSLVVTYPTDDVATGLGDADPTSRPLEATLWGEPPLGRASARLADGTRVRWRGGRWSVSPDREVTFAAVTSPS